MSETSAARTFTVPALQHAQQFNVLERIVELMLEGRSPEVLCVVGGLAAGSLPLGGPEDDEALLQELERHVWARIDEETPAAMTYLEAYRTHPVILNVMGMLAEGAPAQRLWALLTGLMIGAKSPHPRLHAMILINTLGSRVEAAMAPEGAGIN